MKNQTWFTILLGLGLFLSLGSFVHLSNHALARGLDESSVKSTSTTLPITLTVRLLENNTGEKEPDSERIKDNEVPIHINSQDSAPISTLDTSVCGEVSGDWNISGSPYVVTCDIVITTTDTLTIQPGVEVRFNGDYRLIVYSDLLANGTAVAPVTFTSNQSSPQPGDWRGIQFYESGDDDRLSYVQVEFAHTGIEIKAEKGTASPTIEYSDITNSQYNGISIMADATTSNAYARPQILSNTISYNGSKGIYVLGEGGTNDYVDGYAEPTIRNNTIANNSSMGIHMEGEGGNEPYTDGYANGDIVNNTITNNNWHGIYCDGDGGSWGCLPGCCISGSASPNIDGNIITDNASSGIYISANGHESGGFCNRGYASPEVSNNIIVNNDPGITTYALDSYDYLSPNIVNNSVISNSYAGIQTIAVVDDVDIYNNLIISNTVGLYGWSTSATPNVGCNNVWGNGENCRYYPSPYCVMSTTNCAGAASDAYNNISQDPHFVCLSTRNYHLQESSPAIDAGCCSCSAPDHDIEWVSRPQGTRHDLGAYELFASTPVTNYLPIILKNAVPSSLPSGPEVGHYTGVNPLVSFDVSTGPQVCNYDITIPFDLGSCHIEFTSCATIENNTFTFALVGIGGGINISGTFDTGTHASGNYSVSTCGGSYIVPPATGTWEASK